MRGISQGGDHGAVKACKAVGMKPVCDDPRYCKDDIHALYIGQTAGLAYPYNRQQAPYVPDGFAKIESKW
jgi:hypothetical protein